MYLRSFEATKVATITKLAKKWPPTTVGIPPILFCL